MRISKDDSSWKASGIKRRDYRSSKDSPEMPKRGGIKRKKDTKRWCRGIEGKEHDTRYVDHRYYVADECRECGKQLRNYWPRRWGWGDENYEKLLKLAQKAAKEEELPKPVRRRHHKTKNERS